MKSLAGLVLAGTVLGSSGCHTELGSNEHYQSRAGFELLGHNSLETKTSFDNPKIESDASSRAYLGLEAHTSSSKPTRFKAGIDGVCYLGDFDNRSKNPADYGDCISFGSFTLVEQEDWGYTPFVGIEQDFGEINEEGVRKELSLEIGFPYSKWTVARGGYDFPDCFGATDKESDSDFGFSVRLALRGLMNTHIGLYGIYEKHDNKVVSSESWGLGFTASM